MNHKELIKSAIIQAFKFNIVVMFIKYECALKLTCQTTKKYRIFVLCQKYNK